MFMKYFGLLAYFTQFHSTLLFFRLNKVLNGNLTIGSFSI